MSGGTLRTAALGRLAQAGVPAPMQRELSALVHDCDADFLQFVFEAGRDARYSMVETCVRGAALLFEYAAIQLADDLADGECSLSEPMRDGPLLLMELQKLAAVALAESSVTKAAMKHAALLFMSVGTGQYEELRTRSWTKARAVHAARALNGAQYSAYLVLLWDRTWLAPAARSVGEDLGLLIHVTTDILSKDRRFLGLTSRERLAVTRTAWAAAKRLKKYRLSCIDHILDAARPVLLHEL